MAASTTPISTQYTFLMYKASTAATQYTNLVPIKNYPDMGGDPERIDVTTLSDTMRKYVGGVQDVDSFNFTANYIASSYNTLLGLRNKQTEFALWFGAELSGSTVTPDGHDGKFTWTGDLNVYVNGGDVNAASEMTISMFPSTEIAFTY